LAIFLRCDGGRASADRERERKKEREREEKEKDPKDEQCRMCMQSRLSLARSQNLRLCHAVTAGGPHLAEREEERKRGRREKGGS